MENKDAKIKDDYLDKYVKSETDEASQYHGVMKGFSATAQLRNPLSMADVTAHVLCQLLQQRPCLLTALKLFMLTDSRIIGRGMLQR